jgi:hypothetical protein
MPQVAETHQLSQQVVLLFGSAPDLLAWVRRRVA